MTNYVFISTVSGKGNNCLFIFDIVLNMSLELLCKNRKKN